MLRAFLVAFFAGPVPYFLWTTSILRTTHPDLIAMNLGSLLMTVPWLWFLIRFARRPHFLLCWFATAGTLFWTALRDAVFSAGPPGGRALGLVLFPVTGLAALERDGILLFPIMLFVWGTVAGFVRILRRSATPQYEREENPGPPSGDEQPPEPPPEPPPQPHFVERPPPKPKGPAYTPPSKVTPPPRPKRVPGV